MRGTMFIAAGALLIAFGATAAFLFISDGASAQRSLSARYDYAVVTGSYIPYPAESAGSVSGAVNICYLQATGCQNEEQRTDVNISRFLQDERIENSPRTRTLAQERALQMSFAKAINKLGAEGWEMIATPTIEFDLYYTNQQGIQSVKEGVKTDRQHIWFVRTRQ